MNDNVYLVLISNNMKFLHGCLILDSEDIQEDRLVKKIKIRQLFLSLVLLMTLLNTMLIITHWEIICSREIYFVILIPLIFIAICLKIMFEMHIFNILRCKNYPKMQAPVIIICGDKKFSHKIALRMNLYLKEKMGKLSLLISQGIYGALLFIIVSLSTLLFGISSYYLLMLGALESPLFLISALIFLFLLTRIIEVILSEVRVFWATKKLDKRKSNVSHSGLRET